MSKKALTLEEILIEMWEGTRNSNSFLSTISVEAFKGYATAMAYAQDPRINKLGVGVADVFNAVTKLVREEKI